MNRAEEILKATEEMSVSELLDEIDRRKRAKEAIFRNSREVCNFGIDPERFQNYLR